MIERLTEAEVVFALLLTILAILVILGRWAVGFVRATKTRFEEYVNDLVEERVQMCVDESLAKGLDPVTLQLVTLTGEVGRVREIEQKLENGLTSDVQEMKDEIPQIRAQQVQTATQVAEIHGWLKGMHEWDGKERRGER